MYTACDYNYMHLILYNFIIIIIYIICNYNIIYFNIVFRPYISYIQMQSSPTSDIQFVITNDL